MTRPVVLIATTSSTMAEALENGLREDCRRLGLKLEVCPSAETAGPFIQNNGAYDCAEDLFDVLERREPWELADTMVVLDLGVQLVGAFEPKGQKDEGWHRTDYRAGIAVELILRFPQVFPVFLSLSAHVDARPRHGASNGVGVLAPCTLKSGDGDAPDWREFRRLGTDLCKGVPVDFCKRLSALSVPLHFASPLDGGAGLRSVLARFSHGMRCWFDPTGLRTLVKHNFLETVFDDNPKRSRTADQRAVLRRRLESVAVAIDEEREFAMFSGYAAWKYGRRAWMVTTYSEFNVHPLWAAIDGDEAGSDVIVLRDIDLRFPDVPKDTDGTRRALKDVRRAAWSSKIGKSWYVRAISSEKNVTPVGGARKFGRFREGDQQNDNDHWRLGQTTDKTYFGFQKPVTSIYDLKDVLGPGARAAEESMIARLKAVTDVDSDAANGNAGNHGAPYVNLGMAESLLHQARRMDDCPSGHILGALLASEAYEMLLGMSKTTSLEALLEMHRAEVKAETGFPGVESTIQIASRSDDIAKSLQALYAGRDREESRSVRRTYLSQFWADLRIIYRQAERFEAAEQANIESLANGRWIPRTNASGVLSVAAGVAAFLFALNLWALDPGIFVMCLAVFVAFWRPSAVVRKRRLLRAATSLKWWAATAIIWSTAMAISYVLVCDIEWPRFFDVLRQSWMSSISLEPQAGAIVWPKEGHSWPWRVAEVSVIHVTGSYVLFGLLVAMLYRKVTRS